MKLEDYLSLPYTKVLRKDIEENIFVARVEELPGCSAHGGNELEALSNLRDNMELWIEDCLESGDAVPLPSVGEELPSGKWLQRVPRSLHLKLIRLAKSEGVSLNQLVTSTLAEAAGRKVAKAEEILAQNTQPSFVYTNVVGSPCSVAGNQHYDVKYALGMAGYVSFATETYMGRLRDELPMGSPSVQLGVPPRESKRLSSATKGGGSSAEAKKHSFTQ